MVLLYKCLSLLVYPLGLCVEIGVTGLIFLIVGKTTLAAWLIGISFFILLLFSMPFFSNILLGYLESQYPANVRFSKVPAIVLLGGATLPPVPPRMYPELNEAGDRIFHAARLHKKGLAPYIILTGGKKKAFLKGDTGDSDNCSYFLKEFCGLDISTFIIDNNSVKTYQNAVFTDKIFNERKWDKQIILVTSARHMHRSVLIFKKLGFIVYPGATDFNSYSNLFSVRYLFLPTADALKKSTAVLHELYGIVGYFIMGWL